MQGRSGERVRQPVGARASRGSRCVSPCPGQHLLSGLGDPRGGPHGGGAVFARPAPWSPRGRPLAVGEGPGHVPVSRSACPLTGSSCHLRVGEGPGPAAGRLLTSGTAGAGVAVCPHGHSEPSGHATSQGGGQGGVMRSASEEKDQRDPPIPTGPHSQAGGRSVSCRGLSPRPALGPRGASWESGQSQGRCGPWGA